MQIARDRAAPRGGEGDMQRQGAQAICWQQEFILRVYLRIEGEIVAGRADLVDIEVSVANVGDFDDLAAVFADGDLADEVLGQLAERAREEGGCPQALPYYQRLREEHSRTGWASVAESAIERCRKEGRDQL